MIVTEPKQAIEPTATLPNTVDLGRMQRIVEWFSDKSVSPIAKVTVVALGLFVTIVLGSLTGHLGLSLVTTGTIGASVVLLSLRLRQKPEDQVASKARRIEPARSPAATTEFPQLAPRPKTRSLSHVRKKESATRKKVDAQPAAPPSELVQPKVDNSLIPEVPSQPFHTRMYNTVVSSIGGVVDTGKKLMNEPLSFNHSLLRPQIVSSSSSIAGTLPSHFRIGCINGMHTGETGRDGHMAYITNIAQNATIDWVYNRTNGRVADLAETFVFNYNGVSPYTGDLLLKNWTDFHEEHRDKPRAKYLQICHSQGALHVKNQLMQASPEIRNRVIVLAIAPAAVIPRHMCYQSYNYACSSDLVPHGEIVSGILSLGIGNGHNLCNAIANREELVWLDPLPNSSGLNHGFQNQVFKQVIEDRIQEYLNMNGLYGEI